MDVYFWGLACNIKLVYCRKETPKMSDILSEQQTIQTQQQARPVFDKKEFFDQHQALSEKEFETFRQQQQEQIDFYYEFEKRYENIGEMVNGKKEEEKIKPTVEATPVQVEMKEPDKKQLKKEQSRRQSQIKKAQKKGIQYASAYAMEMMDSFNEYKKDTTSPIKDMDEAKLLEEVRAFEINKNLADPNYVAKNMKESLSYINKSRAIVDYFTKDSVKLNGLSLLVQQRVGNMVKALPIMVEAFNNSLLVNGLKLQGDSLVAATRADMDGIDVTSNQKKKIADANASAKEQEEEIVKVLYEEELEKDLKAERENLKNLRKAIETDFTFIHSDRFATEVSYQNIKEFTDLIEQYPDKYQMHKDVLDQMLVYARNAQEIIGKNWEIINLPFFLPKDCQKEVVSYVRKRASMAEKESTAMVSAMANMQSCFKYLLRDKPIGPKEFEFMIRFGYTDPAYKEKLGEYEENASLYINRYNSKTDIWKDMIEKFEYTEDKSKTEAIKRYLESDSRAFMLVKLENTEEAKTWNNGLLDSKVVAAKRALKMDITPEEAAKEYDFYRERFEILVEKVLAVDVDAFMGDKVEELLMDIQEELGFIQMENMHLSDCALIKHPVTQKQLKETVLGSPERTTLYRDKLMLISNAVAFGRILSLMRAYENSILTLDMVTDIEKRHFPSASTPEEGLVEWLKKQYADRKRSFESAKSVRRQHSQGNA